MDEMTQCKVFFEVGTTKEKALEIVGKHTDKADFANFYERKEIGSNVFTFAVITMPLKAAQAVDGERDVIRVEGISNFKGGKCEKECGNC